jgi:hypothetical protein
MPSHLLTMLPAFLAYFAVTSSSSHALVLPPQCHLCEVALMRAGNSAAVSLSECAGFSHAGCQCDYP